jgi:hypothetical protein
MSDSNTPTRFSANIIGLNGRFQPTGQVGSASGCYANANQPSDNGTVESAAPPDPWPPWLADIWGRAPEGPAKRAAALSTPIAEIEVTPEAETYVAERTRRCLHIIAESLAKFRASVRSAAEHPVRALPRHPHEREITATSFVDRVSENPWTSPERRITAADILARSYGCRLVETLAPLNGLPAMPLDQWSADPRPLRVFERRVEALIDAEMFEEAAE